MDVVIFEIRDESEVLLFNLLIVLTQPGSNNLTEYLGKVKLEYFKELGLLILAHIVYKLN